MHEKTKTYKYFSRQTRHSKTVIACALATVAIFCFIQTSSAPSGADAYPTPEPVEAESLDYFAYLLDELDYRRRLQFLFPNPQTIFDGVAIGYVQSSSGNLTFERRDLVVLGSETVVASRIYDSKNNSNSGFGPGWRLNLNETVEVIGNAVIFTEGSGARHTFNLQGSGRYAPSLVTPALQDATLNLIGAGAVLNRQDGTASHFRRVDDSSTYVLVRKTSTDRRSLTFEYDGTHLTGVSIAGNSILNVEWFDERISSMSDLYGRKVTYTYDALGRLSTTTDVGHQSWTYEYDPLGRMVAAAHPDGHIYLEVEYDHTGKVARSSSARDFVFHYFDNETTVKEPTGNQHIFKKSDSGITVGYRNEHGLNWELVLDESNRPLELSKNDEEYRFEYTDLRLTTLDHAGGLQRFHYDNEGRFTHTSGVPV